MLPSSENQSWENQLLASQLQGLNTDEIRLDKQLGFFEGLLHTLGKKPFFAFFGLGKYQWVPVGKKNDQFIYVKIKTLTHKLGLTESDIRASLGSSEKAKEKVLSRQNKVDLLSKMFIRNEITKAFKHSDIRKLRILERLVGKYKNNEECAEIFFGVNNPLFNAFSTKDYKRIVTLYASLTPTKETLEKVLSQLLKAKADPVSIAFLQRVISQAEAISSFPFNKHKLTPLEILHVATVGELALRDPARGDEAIYLRRGVNGLPRALLVDYKNKSFVILSKKMGELQKKGASKKVTDAINVSVLGTNTASTQHFARLVNKQGEELSLKEIALERRYGDVHLIVSYIGKKGFEKTTVVQVPYDGSFEDYIDLDGKPAKKQLTLPEKLQIFQQIGTKLGIIHQGGGVHNDIKLENVLIRKNLDGSYTIKVADFGLTYNPSENTFNPLSGSYGTSSYTCPEVIVNAKRLSDLTQQGQAEDSFALGCLLYEILYPKEVLPWSIAFHNCIIGRETGFNAITAFEAGILQIRGKISTLPPDSKETKILTLCLALLDKDPAKRMRVNTFNSEIASLIT